MGGGAQSAARPAACSENRLLDPRRREPPRPPQDPASLQLQKEGVVLEDARQLADLKVENDDVVAMCYKNEGVAGAGGGEGAGSASSAGGGEALHGTGAEARRRGASRAPTAPPPLAYRPRRRHV
jgi:hypothetical protein